MKRKLIFLVGLVFCFSLTGCQSNKITKKDVAIEEQQAADTDIQGGIDKQESSKEVKEETQDNNDEFTNTEKIDRNSNVSVTFEDILREEKDTDGTLLLSITGNFPTVTIEGNPTATDKINAYYVEIQKAQEDLIKQYVSYAQEDLELLNGDLEYWNGYGLENKYKIRSMDNTIISIVNEGYESFGGPYPNNYKKVQNFDAKTGEFLTLKEVLTDVEQGRKYINDYLLKLLKASEFSSGFVEGYESSVGDILTDNTWYLSEEGFVVICNEGIVSPHVVGIQEYVIPYGEFTYLADKYKKN